MHNQSSSNQDRPTVKIDQVQAHKYLTMFMQFEQKRQLASIEQSKDQYYYLVSTKFINSLKDFCISPKQQREVPFIMNQDLFDDLTLKKLKQGLRQKQDFEIISKESYELLEQFKKNELKRPVVYIGHEKRIPIYLNKYKYLWIKNTHLKQIDKNVLKRQDLSLSQIWDSENATVKDVVRRIMEKEEIQLGTEGRLWRVDKQENLDTLYKYLKVAADKATFQYKIRGFGKKLQNTTRIQDLQMEDGNFFLVELKENYKKWFLQSDNQKKCEGCYEYTELKYPCSCEKVAYCTQQCKEKDKRYHIRSCQFAQNEELNRPICMQFTSRSKKGLVGLRNLGNTCFMNSCLQCLSNTLPLTRYFLNRLYQSQINRSNILGTKGRLVKNYASFIKGMWCDQDSVYTPDSIKMAVSQINPMFSGYAQHDSQQFFSFLIDGIHQDLNRVEKKPYVESIQSNSRPDSDVAQESWMAHIKRNQSIITDLMTGQYKSKVTCPTCSKQSITFDPFITVTLPIPEKIVSNFEGFIFFKNFQKKVKKISFSYLGKPNLVEWKKNIEKITGIKEVNMMMYLVTIYQGIYLAGRQPLSDIVYKMENENKNIFVFELNEEEQIMKEMVDITCRLCKKGYYMNSQFQNLWFKFPLFFEKSSTTGLSIYKRILKFLYLQTYISDDKQENDLKDYQDLMLKKRPFNLVLKFNKKIQRNYSRMEHSFSKELQISDDTSLQALLEQIDVRDCELDIKFTKEGLEYFNFKKLKDFDDQTRKTRQYRQESNGAIQLKDCFNNLSESQLLQNGNEWYCPQCKSHKLATKEMSIYKAPKVLILHLKRFKQKNSFRKEKNESKVNFPTTLDLKPFVIDKTPISSYITHAKKQEIYIPPKYNSSYDIKCSEDPIYDLYAISNHYGGLGGGHYTAYGKNGQSWYDFNDSSVRSVSQDYISGSGAYILFYMRRDE